MHVITHTERYIEKIKKKDANGYKAQEIVERNNRLGPEMTRQIEESTASLLLLFVHKIQNGFHTNPATSNFIQQIRDSKQNAAAISEIFSRLRLFARSRAHGFSVHLIRKLSFDSFLEHKATRLDIKWRLLALKHGCKDNAKSTTKTSLSQTS